MQVCVLAIYHLRFLSFQAVMDVCDPNPCLQGAPCQSVGGTYMCTCPDGYHGSECVSLKSPCTGQHCSGTERFDFCFIKFSFSYFFFFFNFLSFSFTGAMSDSTHRALHFYIILVGTVALAAVCVCAGCVFVISHLHRRRKKQQAVPPEEGINNQREIVNLIRNVDRSVPLQPPAPSLAHTPAPAPVQRCYEEIELTLPPSPAPSHPSPALKPALGPKLDISNREREKLNTFRCTENQELEA